MPWSICSWLFSCPKIETFDTLMIFEPFLWNHDQDLIKWWLWLQNKMLTKNFDFWLPNDHFTPTVDCEAIRVFWLCNFMLKVLKLDMRVLDHIYRHVELDWTFWNFIFLIRTKTLILTVQEALILCNPWGILRLDLAISWRIWEGKFWGTTVAPVQSS